MHTNTMEGLVGASTNRNLVNIPMRVYKEARRRGDTETMKRAMGYADDFSGKAEEYRKKADKGMEEDAKEAREKAESERENAIQRRREERREQEKRIEERAEKNAEERGEKVTEKRAEGKTEGRIEESGNKNLDMAGNGGGGQTAWSGKPGPDLPETAIDTSAGETTDAARRKPALYTKTGEIVRSEPSANLSVSV